MKARASGDRSTLQALDATKSRAEGRAQRASPLSAPDSRTSLAQRDFRAPAYEAGGRTFESCTRYQHSRAGSTGRAAASKAEGSRFDPVAQCQHLDVAKWSKATACKAEGASPYPFESDRRVQASLAQRTRAAGFYPAGRPFESVTRRQFNSPIAQTVERLAVNQEVRGSKPRRGASFISVWRRWQRA